MLRTFTCIMCPRGCGLEAVVEPEGGSREDKGREDKGRECGLPEACAAGFRISRITGNACPKGEQYVRQEIENPMRNIATSILVDGGELPLASVRLTGPVPKGSIFDVMKEIRQVRRPAPVTEGQVVIPDVLGLGVDVIVTKTVESV